MTALAARVRGGTVEALADAVTLSWGWPRRLVALAGGATGALALPPVSFAPAMIVPMTIAVWLIDGAIESSAGGGARAATLMATFRVGWWWGLGYFLAGLWWLGAAFLGDADFLWALPLGVVGLPIFLALFPAFGFLIARLIWPRGAMRPIALAVGLGSSEFLRANLLTGFPWNEYGMALGAHLYPAQAAAYVGLHGLTLLTIALAATPATLPSGWRPTSLAALAAALLLGFGAMRLAEPAPEPLKSAKLRLMQPNIAQDAQFSAENGAAILGGYIKLSDRATSPERTGIADVTHLFWPESPFPFILNQDRGALARIADFLRGGATLVTGAARAEAERNRLRYFNSIETIDSGGLTASRYDKHTLVPFGEYLPFRTLFDWLHISQFVHVPGGFDPGLGPRALRVRGLPDALAMVCYEAIFPNETEARVGDVARVGYILNLTDDAWFGRTAGPYQHFAQARLRAVELGLPMLRVANTGISAIIDARGRIIEETPLAREAVIDGAMPGALPPTWQARWGALTFLVLLGLSAGVCEVARRGARNS